MDDEWLSQLDSLASKRKLTNRMIEKVIQSRLKEIFEKVTSNEGETDT